MMYAESTKDFYQFLSGYRDIIEAISIHFNFADKVQGLDPVFFGLQQDEM